MARPTNPEIRELLREKAIDYVLKEGIADLSLRPLAKALRTNARMLVYHFGSREGLMRDILAGLREREDARIRGWFKTAKKPVSLSDFLRWYWRRLSAPRARSAVLLIFELYALALRDPEAYGGVLTDPIAYWQKLVENAGVATRANAAEATLLLAATRGLLLDLAATNDRTRLTKTVSLLAGLLESPAEN
ncbi:MAG TPA: TetR/AcrR family transcriptional regulator [Candidatus Angelobacter sp.]|jgi:AcrR family transcriptional regulator|nr:TetR/AcrR family transcriptional regulator [Candidatus Angelobacter sp.]